MRSDMDKVLVERPRVGGCGKENLRSNRRASKIACNQARFDSDADVDNSNFGAIKRVHSISGYGDQKQLNENLNPLRRFLRSRVGMPWNDVYSEIMAGLNLNNSVQYHVWQHLIKLGEVETKTELYNGQIWSIDGDHRRIDAYDWREQFYVHPESGLLCVTPKKRPSWKISKDERQHEFDEFRYINPKNPLVQYHRIDGIWYEIGLRGPSEIESQRKSFGRYERRYDFLTGKWHTEWVPFRQNRILNSILYSLGLVEKDKKGNTFFRYFEEDPYLGRGKSVFGGLYLPISKRQMNSQEIKKIESLMKGRSVSKSKDNGVVGFRNGRKIAA